ncbi:MAG: lactate utilization protein [Alphaproteobacteria bacterium]|nr:lactate utilization protein [Alphaproteobacteria bacterium]
MTDARDSILQSLRESSNTGGAGTIGGVGSDEIAAEAQALLDDPIAVRPTLPSADIVDSFITRARGAKVGATVDRIASMETLPATVAAYLAEAGERAQLCRQPTPSLEALDWAAAGIDVRGDIDDGAFVAVALWGISETGSVVVHSAADQPILSSFLCGVQFIVLKAERILAHLEDYAAAVQGDLAPRNACLITGASGTTDIEGSLVKGAHGPRELHIIIVGGV